VYYTPFALLVTLLDVLLFPVKRKIAKFLAKVSFCVAGAELADVKRGDSLPPEVVGAELDRARDGSSPYFAVESPPERLSPSHHQRVFNDADLSPVTDPPPPHGKRKIAINIGASPSGFILEEDEEEEEEKEQEDEEQEEEEEDEIDEELEVVDARMFRPIVQPQSSGDQGPLVDFEPDEETDHVPDLGGEGIRNTLNERSHRSLSSHLVLRSELT